MSRMRKIIGILKKFFKKHYLGFVIITITILLGITYFCLDFSIHGKWFFERKLTVLDLSSYIIIIFLCTFVIIGGIISDTEKQRRVLELRNLRNINFMENVAMKIITESSFDKKVEIAVSALQELVPFNELYVLLEKDGKFVLSYPNNKDLLALFVKNFYAADLRKYIGGFYKGYYISKVDLYDSVGFVLIKPLSPISEYNRRLLEKYKKTIQPLFSNARLVIALKESKNKIEKLLGKYKSMHRFILRLQEASTPEEVYWTVVKLALTFFEADSAFIIDTSDDKRENWRFIAVKNTSEDVVNFFEKKFSENKYNKGIIVEITCNKKPLLVSDLTKSTFSKEFHGFIDKFVKSWLGIPLLIDEEVIAVLNVWSRKAYKFGSEDMVFAYMLSDIVSSILVRIRYLEKLDEYSVTDHLTGLYNKREFYRRMFEEIKKATMYKKKLSIAMFDLDGFKEWNDMYGHIEGDRLLKEVGNLLKARLRSSDMAFRFGGDEFVIVMTETSAGSAEKAMRDILFRVRELTLDKRNKITLSIGIAEYKPNENVEEFIERADKAMYAAKNAGKNRIEVAN